MVTSPNTVHLPPSQARPTSQQLSQAVPCAVSDGDGTVDVFDAGAEGDSGGLELDSQTQ